MKRRENSKERIHIVETVFAFCAIFAYGSKIFDNKAYHQNESSLLLDWI